MQPWRERRDERNFGKTAAPRFPPPHSLSLLITAFDARLVLALSPALFSHSFIGWSVFRVVSYFGDVVREGESFSPAAFALFDVARNSAAANAMR